MGVAYYPVFEGSDAGWPEDINGKCLSRADKHFEKVCRKNSVSTLLEFFSMSRDQIIAELLNGDPDDPSTYDESNMTPEHWHDPAEGLKTIRVLLDFVKANANQFADADCVREDLEAFEKALRWAEMNGVRWHLAMDY